MVSGRDPSCIHVATTPNAFNRENGGFTRGKIHIFSVAEIPYLVVKLGKITLILLLLRVGILNELILGEQTLFPTFLVNESWLNGSEAIPGEPNLDVFMPLLYDPNHI